MSNAKKAIIETNATTSGCQAVNQHNYKLPENLSISKIESIYDDIKTTIGENSQILKVDASEVKNIGTGAVQLIIALEKSLSECGGQISIYAASKEFKAGFDKLGLQDFLTKNYTENHNG